MRVAPRPRRILFAGSKLPFGGSFSMHPGRPRVALSRSEEHTSELQSHSDLVCRLLLEKKKKEQANVSPRRSDSVGNVYHHPGENHPVRCYAKADPNYDRAHTDAIASESDLEEDATLGP